MPELAGTQAGDGLVLRITFDTDAPLIGQTTHPSGGTTFSFDASSLVLALEVPRLGTHVFTIDDTVPPATIPSLVGITDDLVTPGTPIIRQPAVPTQLPCRSRSAAVFRPRGLFHADTSVLSGGILPLSPDPRLGAGFERAISIVAPGSGSLFGTFTSLVRLPTTIPEPGSLALLCLGCAGLWAARRGRADRAG